MGVCICGSFADLALWGLERLVCHYGTWRMALVAIAFGLIMLLAGLDSRLGRSFSVRDHLCTEIGEGRRYMLGLSRLLLRTGYIQR